MKHGPTPREMAKELLNGVLPPRPLCLPVVFSLGAKVENVPLDVFRTNPTKITSALRQLRSPLKADAVTCYFDPCLEVEALGAVLRREGDGSCSVNWPGPARAGEMPGGLCAPEEAAGRGRVTIAREVIRRMNALPNRDFLLMACITGPMKLAAMICGVCSAGGQASAPASDAAKEFASAVATQLATAYLDAGADLILIHEASFVEEAEAWANLLAPMINVTRFYEALPLVQFTEAPRVECHWDLVDTLQRDCVVCIPLQAAFERANAAGSGTGNAAQGLALPIELLASEALDIEKNLAAIDAQIAQTRPAVITTAGDVPMDADMKRVTHLLSYVARTA